MKDTMAVNFPTENFLKIKETLTRVGEKLEGKRLKQLAYILHKKGKYYILHYKQLEMLDNKGGVTFTNEDKEKTKLIISVLANWNLIDMVHAEDHLSLYGPDKSLSGILKIVPYKEKYRWKLISPYDIGNV